MRGNTKTLGEHIRELRGGVDKTGSKDVACNTISELVRVAEDVLGLFERDRISCHVESGFAVEEERRGLCGAKTDVGGKITKVNSLTAGESGRAQKATTRPSRRGD